MTSRFDCREHGPQDIGKSWCQRCFSISSAVAKVIGANFDYYEKRTPSVSLPSSLISTSCPSDTSTLSDMARSVTSSMTPNSSVGSPALPSQCTTANCLLDAGAGEIYCQAHRQESSNKSNLRDATSASSTMAMSKLSGKFFVRRKTAQGGLFKPNLPQSSHQSTPPSLKEKTTMTTSSDAPTAAVQPPNSPSHSSGNPREDAELQEPASKRRRLADDSSEDSIGSLSHGPALSSFADRDEAGRTKEKDSGRAEKATVPRGPGRPPTARKGSKADKSDKSLLKLRSPPRKVASGLRPLVGLVRSNDNPSASSSFDKGNEAAAISPQGEQAGFSGNKGLQDFWAVKKAQIQPSVSPSPRERDTATHDSASVSQAPRPSALTNGNRGLPEPLDSGRESEQVYDAEEYSPTAGDVLRSAGIGAGNQPHLNGWATRNGPESDPATRSQSRKRAGPDELEAQTEGRAAKNRRTDKGKQPEKVAASARPAIDEDAFDALIYGQDGAATPPQDIISIPSLAQGRTSSFRQSVSEPAKPPADEPVYGHIDPRTHWPQRRSWAWYEAKLEALQPRGKRKANFGKAAQRSRQQRLREKVVPFEDTLPEKIAENPAWVRALKRLHGTPIVELVNGNAGSLPTPPAQPAPPALAHAASAPAAVELPRIRKKPGPKPGSHRAGGPNRKQAGKPGPKPKPRLVEEPVVNGNSTPSEMVNGDS
ncbi:hypothetical protein QBC46DRAFT_6204 [Diplogelasinospora grovesii]|uniref:Uncharacterized protein n=1 Tax=Diplogelasinospora grovesii TaxID=303347 RepID=A0AAN6NFA6_9PEZI|nr:hypothetical protein QBC46DRAFT_6204 [Diplogelasinospora grovesii]